MLDTYMIQNGTFKKIEEQLNFKTSIMEIYDMFIL